jgi:1-acyl-sn-glycerol-3-phosphate acyltransferase
VRSNLFILEKGEKMLYHVTLFFYRLYLLISGGQRVIVGQDNIPKSGTLIVVANHVSDIDPWVVANLFSTHRVVRWWAKRELYSYSDQYRAYRDRGFFPPFACVLALSTVCVVRYSHTLPVDRQNVHASLNKQAIIESVRIIRTGGIIGIFGEGGKNREGEAKPVFVKLARKYGVPILPVRISEHAVLVGELIYLDKGPWSEVVDSEVLAQAVMQRISNLSLAVA